MFQEHAASSNRLEKKTILLYFNTPEQSTSLFQKEISLKQQYKQRLSKKTEARFGGH
jgi:uncharacterized protein YllA (UPF0747 family)